MRRQDARRCRRGAAARADAAGGRGCAPARRPPGRGSSPSPGARPAPIQPTSCGSVRWSVSRPSRGTAAATRSASSAQVPAPGRQRERGPAARRAGRSTSRPANAAGRAGTYFGASPPRSLPASTWPRAGEVGGHQPGRRVGVGAPRPAPRRRRGRSLTSATSTRSRNCIDPQVRRPVRRRARARTMIHAVAPSSTSAARARRGRAGCRIRASADPPGASPSTCWVVRSLQPGQPVGPRDGDDAAVATGRPTRCAVARAGAAREAGRRSARRRPDRGCPPGGGTAPGGGRRSRRVVRLRSHAAGLCTRRAQAVHRDVRDVGAEPVLASPASPTNELGDLAGTLTTVPQRSQTRWMCTCSSTAW